MPRDATQDRAARCDSRIGYYGEPYLRCEKPAGHKGVHYSKTLMGGSAWSRLPKVYRP